MSILITRYKFLNFVMYLPLTMDFGFIAFSFYYLRQGGNVFARLCLFVCQQDNSKSYGRMFLKIFGNVGNGKNYKWLNFGSDLERILDSGSL